MTPYLTSGKKEKKRKSPDKLNGGFGGSDEAHHSVRVAPCRRRRRRRHRRLLLKIVMIAIDIDFDTGFTAHLLIRDLIRLSQIKFSLFVESIMDTNYSADSISRTKVDKRIWPV